MKKRLRVLPSFKAPRLRLFLRGLLVLMVCLGIWFDYSLWRVTGAAYTYRLPERPADVILVLGCGPREVGVPSNCQKARVSAAVEVWQAGYASAIILSGGQTGKGVEAEYMAKLAVEQGVPPEKLILEERATSTVENLRYSQALMRERGWHRVILVSDPYHLYRARRQAADQKVEVAGWWPALRNNPDWYDFRKRSFNLARDSLSLMLYEGFGWLLYR